MSKKGERRFTVGKDYVVCRSDPTEGAEAEAVTGESLLVGNLARIEVTDLINFINMARLTGVLTLVDGPTEKSLHFGNGELTFASSSANEDRIGEVLVRLGKINPRQLAAVSEEHRDDAKLGRFMVQQGLIAPQVLWEAIRQQVSEIFFGFIEASKGTFFFLDTEPADAAEFNLSLKTSSLLLEGVQRKDELSHYRKRIVDDEVVFARRTPLPTKELASNEKRILELVDGNSSVSDLTPLSQMDRFRTLKTLFHLLQAGFIEICKESLKPGRLKTPPAQEAQEQGGQSEERATRDVIGVFNEIFVEIHQAVCRHMTEAGALKALNAFFLNLDPALSGLFRGLELRKNGSLDEDALLRNLARAKPPDPRAFLTDGLKELFFFCVFEATSHLDPDEEETLMTRIHKLQKNLRT